MSGKSRYRGRARDPKPPNPWRTLRRGPVDPCPGGEGAPRMHYPSRWWRHLLAVRRVSDGAARLYWEVVENLTPGHVCAVPPAELAERLGVSRRTVGRREAELARKGLLRRAKASLWWRRMKGGVRRILVLPTVDVDGAMLVEPRRIPRWVTLEGAWSVPGAFFKWIDRTSARAESLIGSGVSSTSLVWRRRERGLSPQGGGWGEPPGQEGKPEPAGARPQARPPETRARNGPNKPPEGAQDRPRRAAASEPRRPPGARRRPQTLQERFENLREHLVGRPRPRAHSIGSVLGSLRGVF